MSELLTSLLRLDAHPRIAPVGWPSRRFALVCVIADEDRLKVVVPESPARMRAMTVRDGRAKLWFCILRSRLSQLPL